MPDKSRVRLTPKWLDAMVPPVWFAAAEQLAEMAEVNKVPADRMRTFIRVASALPNIPLLEGVRMLIAGEIKLVAETQADTATEPSKSRLILPPGV